MKRLIIAVIASLGCIIPASAQHRFVVHEWGTFTTLAGSDGVLLPGLYHEEETLPNFVDHFGGFVPDGNATKGLYLPCTDVTLKMETPVLYFYSDIARSVTVDVRFPAGTISQWYPNRIDGEVLNTDTLRFGGAPHNGWISWGANILAPATGDTIGLWKPSETNTWTAPRATDANIVSGPGGQVEKFIFYRGVGNAAFMDGGFEGNLIFKTYFKGDTLYIDNQTYYQSPFGFVFERTEDGQNIVWWSGLLNGAQRTIATAPQIHTGTDWQATLQTFHDKLVESGLYPKEADAMISTWQQSYFGTPGLRFFWIVPRLSTDRSLPLTIAPQPDSTERVLVARSEILAPEFEQALVASFKKDGGTAYINDRYYLAYKARFDAINLASVSPSTQLSSGWSVYPNPAQDELTVSLDKAASYAFVTVVDALGRELLRSSTFEGNSTKLKVSEIPAGVYTLQLIQDGVRSTERVVKE